MSVRQQWRPRVSNAHVAEPVIDETPTLPLGSMLLAVREQNRGEGQDFTMESESYTFSEKELADAERIPRRRLPLLVFLAGVGLASFAASAQPNIKAVVERGVSRLKLGASSILGNAQARPVPPTNLEPTSLEPVNAVTIVGIADAGVADSLVGEPQPKPQAESLVPSVENRVQPAAVETPAPREHGGKTATRSRSRRPHPVPLRGYAWSPAANAMVRIDAETMNAESMK